jgi:hypothetical protein
MISVETLLPSDNDLDTAPLPRPAPTPPPNIKLERIGVTSHFTSELWQKEAIFARSIAAKLWESGRNDLATPLELCHTSETSCHCLDCGAVQRWWNRCDRFYCPMCISKLVFRRRQSIQAWSEAITQPKHVVLTARNTAHLSHNHVKYFKNQLGKLRRAQCHNNWRGGLCSLEVTNEGRGWHLHCHLLVDTDWVDTGTLATTWARLVQQDFAVVSVRDTRDGRYLQEVTKYAVKGSQLASWSGIEEAEFIDAMTGVRQFSVFGSLFKDRILRQKIKKKLTPNGCKCSKCFSERLRFLDENEEKWLNETGRWPDHKW